MELYSDKEVMRYAYLDRLITREKAEEAFRETLELQKTGQGTQYVVTIKNTATDIAIVDYEVIYQNAYGGMNEIGYFIKKEFWGCGYGCEMGQAIIDELFTNRNIHKVVASCNSNNQASENIMKKLGMYKEGVLRKIRFKDGRWDDEIKYGLLREEWEQQNRI
jgi:ribosomal-protein-alanine N-acetyltransferase